MNRNHFLKTALAGIALSWFGLAAAQTGAVLIYDDTKPALKFAAGDLKVALEQKNLFTVATLPPSQLAAQTAPVQVVVTTNGAIAGQPPVAGLAKEGYAIRRVTTGSITRWWLIGNDAPGAMYAALDAADSVKIDASLINVVDKQVNPNLAIRGIKFNIPLDDRTPSYADDSAAGQYNTAEMWSLPYWQRFLDQMARSRLNSLSLWNRHPFPSMVKVPEYPNVALSDVKAKTGLLNGGSNKGGTAVTVRTMSIDDKIRHWRDVMQYAQDRGVAVSLFTWNIHVYGTENSGYGLTDSASNTTTKDYFRKSVRSLIQTYPLLAGIGVTAGENLDLSASGKEQWVWDTYGQGYADAVRDMQDPASAFYNPSRKVKFFHRAHEVNVQAITDKFNALPGYTDEDSSLNLTYKYSQAHMHASTKPLFISNWLPTVPTGKKVTMEVRNDDFFNVRWGDPDFARAYLNNLPDRSKINGLLIGPDGYTWGREVVSKNPQNPRQQYIDKAWYSFMLWGYLAYDPFVSNDRFQALLGARYPEVPSGNLYSGLASVSKVYPLITRFFWGRFDFEWYPEASFNDANRYLGVQAFIDPVWDPMNASEDGDAPLLMSVKDYVNNVGASGRLSPVDVAAKLRQYSDAGALSVSNLNPGSNVDLQETIGDVKATAWLGRYYADKILGAVELYRYQKDNSNAAALAAASTHLKNSAEHWRQYAAQWSSQYQKQYVGRVNALIDMVALQASVDKDIPGGGVVTPPPPPPLSDAYDITSLVLVNASNGVAIRTLQASEALSLSNLGAPSISIQALSNAGAKSVKFVSAEAGVSRTEGNAPWAFLGNSGSTYTPWKPVAKTYTITATGYSASGASGTAGKSVTITINVTP
jgi:hypothetical protein